MSWYSIAPVPIDLMYGDWFKNLWVDIQFTSSKLKSIFATI